MFNIRYIFKTAMSYVYVAWYLAFYLYMHAYHVMHLIWEWSTTRRITTCFFSLYRDEIIWACSTNSKDIVVIMNSHPLKHNNKHPFRYIINEANALWRTEYRDILVYFILNRNLRWFESYSFYLFSTLEKTPWYLYIQLSDHVRTMHQLLGKFPFRKHRHGINILYIDIKRCIPSPLGLTSVNRQHIFFIYIAWKPWKPSFINVWTWHDNQSRCNTYVHLHYK